MVRPLFKTYCRSVAACLSVGLCVAIPSITGLADGVAPLPGAKVVPLIRADAFEDDDSSSRASTVTLSETQHHSFHDSGDVDWAKFVLTEGGDIGIRANNLGRGCDTIIELYGLGARRRIARVASDGPDMLFAHFISGGTFYIRVTNALPGSGPGVTYDLTVFRISLYSLSGGIAGVVRDADTLLPIPNATVHIESFGTIDVPVDSEGAYAQNTVTGDYTVSVTAEGYLEDAQDVTVNQGAVAEASFDLVATTHPILSVSPDQLELGASSGSALVNVENEGTGDLEWNASVTTGSDWLSLDAKSSGVNAGTVTINYPDNPTDQPRTGEVVVEAAGAQESPAAISILQVGNTPPILVVTPESRNVSSASGTRSFSVTNAGFVAMDWSAEVLPGAAWLSIQSGSSGVNTGTISVRHTQNLDTEPRSGVIRVTAPNAADSPTDVTVNQSGKATPILSVTPAAQAVDSPAGTTAFTVSNEGAATLTWSASVLSGGEWLRISDGAAGTDDGVITLAYTNNFDTLTRSGIVEIVGIGAGNSPTSVEVVQAASAKAPTDINGDSAVDAVDVQLVINGALGIPSAFDGDANGDAVVDAVDVQLVINAALGIPS